MKYVIDGIFLCKKVTGIQRYAIELTKQLDKLVDPGEIELAVPKDCDNDLELKNISVVQYGKRSDRLWEQIDLPKYLRLQKAQGIFFENTVPLTYRHGIVAVHDISLRVNPKLFTKSIKGFLSIAWRWFMYYIIMKSRMKIITVSEFSKKEIIKYYHIDPNRISVVYNAWQHMVDIIPDNSVFNDERIVQNKYYFAMATLAPNKNFKWIAEVAENNPNETFVIAGGGKIKDVIEKEYCNLKNLLYLGYISDNEAKALMGNCRAFLFPSFYEGFGIPPLEALACGAKNIIISDIEVMHEIYGENATYIVPYDYRTFFVFERTIKSEEILQKYSWEKSAKRIETLLSHHCLLSNSC